MVELDPTTCHYCGTSLKGKKVHLDHIIARTHNGSDEPWNRAPACQPCNSHKSSAWPTCRCKHCLTALFMYIEDNPHMSRTLTLRIPDELHEELRTAAHNNRQSINTLATAALTETRRKPMTLRLPDEMHEHLRVWAHDRHTTITALILASIEHGIDDPEAILTRIEK